MVCSAPRGPGEIVGPRRLSGAVVRPLNFTVSRQCLLSWTPAILFCSANCPSLVPTSCRSPFLRRGLRGCRMPRWLTLLFRVRPRYLHTPGCRIFKLHWSSYIAYSVRNESYAQNGRDVFEGRLFRIFSRSHFLDYVGASTLVTSDYPGSYRHWSLVCSDHVIDVISTVEPRIEVRIDG